MIGFKIKSARLEAKMSQAKLARECNLDRCTIFKIESGLSDPRSETIKAIADALGVQPGIFFEETAYFSKCDGSEKKAV